MAFNFKVPPSFKKDNRPAAATADTDAKAATAQQGRGFPGAASRLLGNSLLPSAAAANPFKREQVNYGDLGEGDDKKVQKNSLGFGKSAFGAGSSLSARAKDLGSEVASKSSIFGSGKSAFGAGTSLLTGSKSNESVDENKEQKSSIFGATKSAFGTGASLKVKDSSGTTSKPFKSAFGAGSAATSTSAPDRSQFKWKSDADGAKPALRRKAVSRPNPLSSSGPTGTGDGTTSRFKGSPRLNRVPPHIPSAMKWTRKALDEQTKSRSQSPAAQAEEKEAAGLGSHPSDSKQFRSSPSRTFAPPSFVGTTSFSKKAGLTRDQTSILGSLAALRGRNCPLDYDRYMILDERDKLLCRWRSEREKLDFPHTRGKSRKVDGECESMCSEKERYMRETQKRISAYECEQNGKMDASRLVKEYARSAADQEKPLAHELRTREMLQNSMSYLLLEILDKMPDQPDEWVGWYDFLWSRTRAIRKEVTQLMMSDELAVALVERCTRLHIVCSYLLCSLEVEKFDQKMNTENLGKCLQTLRHLYEDLDKRGIHLETEPEFRAYDVMMHLHDSNVLRQVLSYRKEVRESRQVRFAIQIASAMQNKNYVRFFRLLKSDASFLQCCICHRFFNTVRSEALAVMVNSFGRNSSFPVETITSILAFDDEQGAIQELDCYGVRPHDMERDHIDLNRESFSEGSWPPLKRYEWIKAKRSTPLSQVVYGPGLISPFHPTSHLDSFDANGNYTRDSIVNGLIEKYKAELPSVPHHPFESAAPAPVAKPPVVDPLQPYANWISTNVDQIVDDVVEEPLKTVARTVFVDSTAEQFLGSVADDILKSVLLSAFVEGQRLAAEEEKREREIRLKKALKGHSDGIAAEVLEGVVREEIRRIAAQEQRNAVHANLREAIDWIGNRLWENRFITSLDKELKQIIKQTIKEEEEALEAGLNRFGTRMRALWLRQFWDMWRERAAGKRRFREERELAWEQFRPVWDSPLFNADAYLKKDSNTTGRRTSRGPSLDVATAVRLSEFRSRRRVRIVGWAFDRWREFVLMNRERRRVQKLMLHAAAHHHSFASSKEQSSVEPREDDEVTLWFSGKSSTRANRRRPLSPSLSSTPFVVRRKAARLSLAEHYPFLHPDDSVFQTPAPMGREEAEPAGSSCSVYHSTPFIGNATLARPRLDSVSVNGVGDYGDHEGNQGEERTQWGETTILSENDLSYARQFVNNRELSGAAAYRERPRTMKTVEPVVKSPVLDESKKLLDEARQTSEAVSSWEQRATELEAMMREQQNLIDRLVKMENNKRMSL